MNTSDIQDFESPSSRRYGEAAIELEASLGCAALGWVSRGEYSP